jgi:hypothetical protein
VNFGGVHKNAVIDMMNNFMVGNAINLLWRTQKNFIMSVVIAKRGIYTTGKKTMSFQRLPINGAGSPFPGWRPDWEGRLGR